LKILDVLQIKEEDKYETGGVAHYTTKTISQRLFFDKVKEKDKDGKEITVKDKDGNEIPVPFQLNSVTNSNDLQEGKTLFNYLFDNQKVPPQPEQYVAFVGCFTFNYDNLNQFRLYGKEGGTKEGTGISIVMNSNFYRLVGKSPVQKKDRQTSQDDIREHLFRCIYFDPDTSQVVSVGHRDFHTFYKTKEVLYNRENREAHIKEITKDIARYKKVIDKKVNDVRKYLEELKKEISEVRKQKIDEDLLYKLLSILRYLVKHVAFKEEQECRIVKMINSSNKDYTPIDENHERFYVNYLPLTNCVSKIYFGPKATGMELFQSLLTYHGFEEVTCHRSTSPLA